MGAPTRLLRAGEHTLELGPRPLLMGIVNASPDSFSDGGLHRGLDEQVELARALIADGADVIDVGGESASTGSAPMTVEVERERVVPLIERIAGELGAIVSVDTYKPLVASAAIDAGASIVNDVSGLRDPQLAEVCAEREAGLVVMHTAVEPRVRRQDPGLYADVTQEVLDFLRARIEVALAEGVQRDQLIVDPGPDFAKTPAQSVRLLADVGRMHELGRPVLMAVSRKDFIGALTDRRPRERAGGTLAAVAHGLDHGAHIFRVHDVALVADYLTVRAALRDAASVEDGLALREELRYDRDPFA